MSILEKDSPCTPDSIVTENMFRQYLADPTRNDFSFAREDDTCAATNTEVKIVETQCDKSCGCGTYTKTYTCVYKGGDQNGEEVPTDSEDYSCSCPKNKGTVSTQVHCTCKSITSTLVGISHRVTQCDSHYWRQISVKPFKVETYACNVQCCPEWHQCDNNSCNANTANSLFSPGTTWKYENCQKECGAETIEAELRCMCENTCEANYANDVLGITAPKDDFTLHQWDACAAGVKEATDGVTDSKNIDYRITREKACVNPCCVTIETNNNTCPQLDCSNTEFSMPWNINYNR